jgi:hypothetical protein
MFWPGLDSYHISAQQDNYQAFLLVKSMDIMFSDTANTHQITSLQSAAVHRTQILSIFQEAVQRAQQYQRQILVSITFPAQRFDALHVFTSLQQIASEDRFYWERATDRRALVGLGQAAII